MAIVRKVTNDWKKVAQKMAITVTKKPMQMVGKKTVMKIVNKKKPVKSKWNTSSTIHFN